MWFLLRHWCRSGAWAVECQPPSAAERLQNSLAWFMDAMRRCKTYVTARACKLWPSITKESSRASKRGGYLFMWSRKWRRVKSFICGGVRGGGGGKSLISSNSNYFSSPIINMWKGAINYQPRCLSNAYYSIHHKNGFILVTRVRETVDDINYERRSKLNRIAFADGWAWAHWHGSDDSIFMDQLENVEISSGIGCYMFRREISHAKKCQNISKFLVLVSLSDKRRHRLFGNNTNRIERCCFILGLVDNDASSFTLSHSHVIRDLNLSSPSPFLTTFYSHNIAQREKKLE